VVCSRRDAEAVFGCSGDDEQVALQLRERWAVGAEVVALTLSERGVLVVGADGRVVRQAAYPTAVVDRFGAGDAFTAGFLWGLLDGDIETAARAGAALAALKCTVHGDFARFTADEVRAVIDDPPNALLR
jgi:2-dehydro-3-deoxygluconokinase